MNGRPTGSSHKRHMSLAFGDSLCRNSFYPVKVYFIEMNLLFGFSEMAAEKLSHLKGEGEGQASSCELIVFRS